MDSRAEWGFEDTKKNQKRTRAGTYEHVCFRCTILTLHGTTFSVRLWISKHYRIKYTGCVHLMRNIMVYNVPSHNPVCFTRVFAEAYMSPVAADSWASLQRALVAVKKHKINSQQKHVEHGIHHSHSPWVCIYTHIFDPKVTMSLFQLTSQLMMQPSNNISNCACDFSTDLIVACSHSASHGELICEIHIPCLGKHRLVRWESYKLSFQDFWRFTKAGWTCPYFKWKLVIILPFQHGHVSAMFHQANSWTWEYKSNPGTWLRFGAPTSLTMRQQLQGLFLSFSALLSLESRLVKQLLDGSNLPFGQDGSNCIAGESISWS